MANFRHGGIAASTALYRSAKSQAAKRHCVSATSGFAGARRYPPVTQPRNGCNTRE